MRGLPWWFLQLEASLALPPRPTHNCFHLAIVRCVCCAGNFA